MAEPKSLSLRGIICYYDFQTGDYLNSKYFELSGDLTTAIAQMDIEAKGGEKRYKQIFIQNPEGVAKKNVYYKANFK